MSIADMLNMARSAQAYQQAQQTNPLALRQQQAETEFAEQQKPKLLKQADLAIQLAEGTNPSKIAQAKAESESTQLKLSGEKLARVLQISGARATDPEVLQLSQIAGDPKAKPEMKKAAKDRLHELNAEDMQTAINGGLTMNEALQAFGHLTNKIDNAPQQLPLIHQNAVRIGSGSTGQLPLQTPTTGTNAANQTIALNPVTGKYEIMGTPETNPKGLREQTYTDPRTGNLVKTTITPQGTLGQSTNLFAPQSGPLPSGTSLPSGFVGMSNPNAPMPIPAGENAETLKGFQAERNDAKESASRVSTGLNNIDTVMKYLNLAETGNLSSAIAGFQSIAGNFTGSKKEELAAAARDIIQKNIADLALAKNAALGGKFAENLKLAETSLANAEKNPTAIASSMAQLKPLLQHVRNYQVGLEKTIANHNGDVSVKRQFDNAMNVAFDPLALQLGNAHKTGGAEGVKEFVKKNHISAAQQAELVDKLSEYQKLVKGEL
jgi:hypothetical protein